MTIAALAVFRGPSQFFSSVFQRQRVVPSLPDVAGSFDPLRRRLEVVHRDGGSIAVPSESASVI